jgi:hypothetical protein
MVICPGDKRSGGSGQKRTFSGIVFIAGYIIPDGKDSE